MIRPDVNRLRDRGADEHEGKHGACWQRSREPIGYHGKGEVENLDRPQRLPGCAGRVCERCTDLRGRGALTLRFRFFNRSSGSTNSSAGLFVVAERPWDCQGHSTHNAPSEQKTRKSS